MNKLVEDHSYVLKQSLWLEFPLIAQHNQFVIQNGTLCSERLRVDALFIEIY
jgi:hypothetical protein